YMRGLVPNKLLEHLTLRLTSANIAKTLMQNFVLIVWNGFYESIWKEQCRLIGLWEKEEGITIKEKRRNAKKKHTSIGKVKNAGIGRQVSTTPTQVQAKCV
ncbi:5807_t:CDS:1, partial [Gigaspora rosea]